MMWLRTKPEPPSSVTSKFLIPAGSQVTRTVISALLLTFLFSNWYRRMPVYPENTAILSFSACTMRSTISVRFGDGAAGGTAACITAINKRLIRLKFSVRALDDAREVPESRQSCPLRLQHYLDVDCSSSALALVK